MYRASDKVVWSHTFADVDAMASFVESHKHHASYASNGNHNHAWTFGADLDAAIDLARRGWHAGNEQITRVRAAMPDARVNGRGGVWRNDVGGFIPNVPRAIIGLPDSMRRKVNGTNARGRVVSIAVNPSMSGGLDAGLRVNQGAAIVALIDSLESAGYRVHVTLDRVQTATRDRGVVRTACDLKQATEPLDVDRLAFWLAHPAALRRMFFNACEWITGYEKNAEASGNSGQPNNYATPDGVRAVHGEQVLYFPSLSTANHGNGGLGDPARYATAASAAKCAAEIVARFNDGESFIW